MNVSILTFALRGTRFFRAFWTFPVFVVFTSIPWVLSYELFEYSRQFSIEGRSELASAFEWAGWGIASLTGIATLVFLVFWLALIARAIIARRRHHGKR